MKITVNIFGSNSNYWYYFKIEIMKTMTPEIPGVLQTVVFGELEIIMNTFGQELGFSNIVQSG